MTGFSYADPQGNFMYVIRNAKGGFDTKLVDRRNGGHKVTWTRRDADGNVTAVETDANDSFDPRTRPWYQGAEASRGRASLAGEPGISPVEFGRPGTEGRSPRRDEQRQKRSQHE